MKPYLVGLILLLAAAATGSAETFSSSVGRNRQAIAGKPAREAPIRRQVVAGAVPRAFRRGGNPLQMFNPRAPQKYFGSVQDTVTYDEYNPSRITGIILFGFRW